MSTNTRFESQLANEIENWDPEVCEEVFTVLVDENNSLYNLYATRPPKLSANSVSYEQISTFGINTRHVFSNNSNEQYFGGDFSLPSGSIITSTNYAVDKIQTSSKNDVSTIRPSKPFAETEYNDVLQLAMSSSDVIHQRFYIERNLSSEIACTTDVLPTSSLSRNVELRNEIAKRTKNRTKGRKRKYIDDLYESKRKRNEVVIKCRKKAKEQRKKREEMIKEKEEENIILDTKLKSA